MIELKSADEIKRISDACKIVASALDEVSRYIDVGITTLELERVADAAIERMGGIPAFKGYRGFPSSICSSVNNQVVHGIPSNRKLKDGEILSVDLGVILDGYYGDSAVTLPVGRISQEAKRLMRVTLESLDAGIQNARPGLRLTDISNAVQVHVEQNGFSVVRDFVGHGIGKKLHEEPQIPNYGPPGRGVRLQEGMTLAIEPMVNVGGYEVVVLDDGWTTVTLDGSLSAHFEHTVVITQDGPVVLTEL